MKIRALKNKMREKGLSKYDTKQNKTKIQQSCKRRIRRENKCRRKGILAVPNAANI